MRFWRKRWAVVRKQPDRPQVIVEVFRFERTARMFARLMTAETMRVGVKRRYVARFMA